LSLVEVLASILRAMLFFECCNYRHDKRVTTAAREGQTA
jgi:hypothetical protein